MKVDFNNIRTMLINEYSSLCYLLNHSQKVNESVIVNSRDLKSSMDAIRTCIGIIASTSIEGRDDFKAVGNKELPHFEIIND